jgi:microcystin-dependent protein
MTLEVFPLWMLYKDFEVPVGSIVIWPTTTPPSGWKVCDGSAISRSIYKELWNSIREIYGSGDGSSTFNIPNLVNTFVKGTAPNYVSGNYTWSGRDVVGSVETEQFNHQMLTTTVGGSVGMSTHTVLVQYQVELIGGASHVHQSAVQEKYRWTTIDNTDEIVAGHDNTQSSPDGTQRHLPGKRRTHGERVNGVQKPYGTYYDDNGRPDKTVESFQGFETWQHSHSSISHTSSNSSQGIIGGVDGTSLINKSGGGQIAPGTNSQGDHVHQVTYSISRNHSHTVSGQTGNITLTGLNGTIQPRYMPMLYIIYTGGL